MEKYIYQKFLLQCEYEKFDMSALGSYTGNMDYVMPLGTGYCLFDLGNPIVRRVDIDWLDNNVDTGEDWRNILAELKMVDELVVCNTKPCSDNIIVAEYRAATIKAYLYRLSNASTNVKIYYNVTDRYRDDIFAAKSVE